MVAVSLAASEGGYLVKVLADAYKPGSQMPFGNFESPWYFIPEPGILTMVVEVPHVDPNNQRPMEFRISNFLLRSADAIETYPNVFGLE